MRAPDAAAGYVESARGKPTVVRCRMSNACFARSTFMASDPAGSHFFTMACGAGGLRNFLRLLSYVLHFATSEGPSKGPMWIAMIAVRGASQRRRRAG
jgi:hypothetical protein